MKIPVGTRHDTGETIYIFDETAEWTFMGNNWWLAVAPAQNGLVATVYIKRPEGWVPAHGFKENEQPWTYGAQLEEMPRK